MLTPAWKAHIEELQPLVLAGTMAGISAKTIRENTGNAWGGDRAAYELAEHAQRYLERESSPQWPLPRGSAIKHAIAIIAAAKVQIVAEGWGASFPIDQAWSQSELHRMVDVPESPEYEMPTEEEVRSALSYVTSLATV